MAKCEKCNKRKAKRYCVALGVSLCPLCCGLLREKEIHCPPSCTYLKQHKPYQEKRIIEKKQTSLTSKELSEEDILSDERMAWLAFHIEMPLKAFAEKKESFKDRDALLALAYAKEKIDKEKSILFMPDERAIPKNKAGEAVYKSIEECRYEKKIIIPGEKDTYEREEKIKCLDRIILSIKLLAKENIEGRNYIQRLLERFAQLKEISRQKKIVPSP